MDRFDIGKAVAAELVAYLIEKGYHRRLSFDATLGPRIEVVQDYNNINIWHTNESGVSLVPVYVRCVDDIVVNYYDHTSLLFQTAGTIPFEDPDWFENALVVINRAVLDGITARKQKVQTREKGIRCRDGDS